MASAAENSEVAREFVSMALVGEVVDVKVLGCAAVHAAAAGALESVVATGFPFRAPEIRVVLRLPDRPLPFFHH
jgi:hypothetical protein